MQRRFYGLFVSIAKFLLFSLVLFSPMSWAAGELFEMNTSVRALGMGNAYGPIVKDSDSLFYNPAGLARVDGFNWLIFDPRVAVGKTALEQIEQIQDIQDDSGFQSAIRELYGDRAWTAAGLKSAISIPYFGAAVYDSLDVGINVHNPVYPAMDVSAVNDFGYVLGVGIPIAPILHFGVVVKRIKRIGNRRIYGPSYIGTLDPDIIVEDIKREGVGYGFDLGANLVLPLPLIDVVASAVWKDVGQTKFETGSESALAPPPQDQEMSVGLGVNIDAPLISITPAVEFKHLNREDIQLPKKVHMGVEVGLPLLDLRAGIHQGYYTLGVGVNLGLLRADVATYGVELGEYPGQLEDRRYAVQLSLELGFNPSLSFIGGGSGGGGSRSPGKRLKQRR